MAPWLLRAGCEADGPQALALRDLLAVKRARPHAGHALVDKLRGIVPFDGIAVSGLDREGLRFGRGIFLATNLPPLFLEAYVREGHAGRDPLLAQLAGAPGMVSDDEAEHRRLGTRREGRLSYLLDYFEIGQRSFIPLCRADRLYGGIVLTRAKPFGPPEIDYLQLVAAPLHAALSQPVHEELGRPVSLTTVELGCLEGAAQGLTSEGIADRQGRSVASVDSFLKSATRKLGATGRSHAVAQAMRLGLLG